jgi:hypothetical protein
VGVFRSKDSGGVAVSLKGGRTPGLLVKVLEIAAGDALARHHLRYLPSRPPGPQPRTNQ